jgi:arylsulfatase A-like enzyme
MAGIPDLAPTFLALAGVSPTGEYAAELMGGVMDGRSLKPLLMPGGVAGTGAKALDGASLGDDEWATRTSWLVEYYATTIQDKKLDVSSHLKDNANNVRTTAAVLTAAASTSATVCHMLSRVPLINVLFLLLFLLLPLLPLLPSQTFIGLRTHNATWLPEDEYPSSASNMLAYFEFTDVSADWDFHNPDFCELYDLEKDEYQLTNLCPTASAALKSALHQQLAKAFKCAGSDCP